MPAQCPRPRAPPRGAEANSLSLQFNTQKEAKSHFCLFSLMSIRMEVNAARIKKGRAPNGAPQRGDTAASTARIFTRRAHGRFPPSSRQFVLTAQNKS